MNVADLQEEITKFKTTCDEIQKDADIKSKASGMARSFCVLVLQSSYHPQSNKSYVKFENYRVLVGE